MINTSTEYQQALAEKRRFVARASCLLKNGTVLDIDKTNLMAGGIKIADGVSSTSKFEIGSAIINQLTIMVFNEEEMFSEYDFTDAVITVWVGMPLDDRIEWLKKGVFNAADPTTTPGVITLKSLDNMSKFDAAYDGGIGFPATLQTIVQHCCTQCGVLLVNGEFPNYRYRVTKNPFGDTTNITYRAIIAYCALLAGCYARCNVDGRLEFKWYNTTAFDDIIDGGVFDETDAASYQSGANLDGGNFTDYTSGDTADGGTFTDILPYHHIYSFSSLSVSTEDVVITGIRVTAVDSEDSAGKKIEGETYLCGAEGYVLDVSGNPLIEAGKAKEVAEYLAGRVVGMRFRPFQASAIGDPSWEAGDAAVVTDRKGNSYHTYLTNITYSTGGYASISCDAEPAARHSADRYAEINKIVSNIKKDSQQKLSEYADYVNQLNSLAINAMGYYETSETQSDGSTINYMHDKPLLSESTIVYKKTIDGFFISRDGGKTYVGGMDKDANIVANVIAAIGISFDWAHGGTLTLGGKDNGNGKLTILNAAGKEVGYIDNTGVNFIEGTFSGKLTSKGDKTDTEITGGQVKVAFSDDVYTTYKGASSSDGFGSSVIIHGTKGKACQKFFVNDICLMNVGSAKSGVFNRPIISFDEGIYSQNISYLNTVCFGYNSDSTTLSGRSVLVCQGNHSVQGWFTCSGTKSRVVDTEDYSERLLYCYETAEPMFGDMGTAVTDENGICFIAIDDIFAETVNLNIEYSVFLQKEGPGDIWIDKKDTAYFVVKGTPNLPFSWEQKVIQKDYEHLRLDDKGLTQNEADIEALKYGDIEDLLEEELKQYDMELEGLNHG